MFNFLSSDLSLVEDDLLWEYGNAQITAAAQLTGTAQNTNRIGSKNNTSIHDIYYILFSLRLISVSHYFRLR